ncbi:glycosyltransferase [uncultured Mailhella sp.]|uniref:glycosyltransferase n=1 Tax=uncultured Mailhella sp. TaxID=1981031 RepID=UPI002601B24A|nr:glycosyltransferase [uncultured Mailhella sp.]
MANPLVSVIIPSYRHERFIRECIKSVILQSYSPLELLLIDDASPDGTLQAAESLRAECGVRFVRTVMLSKKKRNTAVSCNLGIDMAQGKYVYLIASDDAAEPNAVQELVQVLESRPDVVLAVGDCSIMDDASRRIGWDADRRGIPLEKARFKTFGEYLRLNIPSRRRNEFGSYASLLEGNYIPNGYLMRTDALRAIGGYNTSVLLEDWYMNLQLAKLGGMVYLPRMLYRYRWHEDNVIKTYGTEETGRKIYREIYALEEAYCREHGLLSIIRRRHPDSLHSRWHRGRRRVLKAVNHIFYINLTKRKFSVFGREFHFL